MNSYALHLLLLFVFIFIAQAGFATHNRAGEIRIDQTGALTIRATIITYTKASSFQADRDTLTIMWGDGTSQKIGRTNGNGAGVVLPNDMRFNTYIAEHTYPAQSTYTISMMDPNRNQGILNVNPPNSDNVPFYIETTYTFLNAQFQGFNNSARLLQPPIDFGCVGRRFIHNPGAFDPDGDSVSFELVVPLQNVGTQVPDYSFPNQINPGGNNNINLNTRTGEFSWTFPQRAGEYNIAIRIREHRNGRVINSFIRDLQILIQECDNSPPVIRTEDEICVVAGDLLEVPVEVTDPDRDPVQSVRVEMRGGPFIQQISPAEQVSCQNYERQPINCQFRWQTVCEHIQPNFYQVIIRAIDNFQDSTGLADIHTLNIKVLGPPPQNLTQEENREFIRLQWDAPYACEAPSENSFRGFTIWRKEGIENGRLSECDPDPRQLGYAPIAFAENNQVGEFYQYTDFDLEKGKTYCYRITGEFAQFTQQGNPFNSVHSIPSDPVCGQLLQDIPLITEVSVINTDIQNGQIALSWKNANPIALDTLTNPPPYRLIIERANGMSSMDFSPIAGAEFNANSFAELLTFNSYIDSDINTLNQAYNYRIAFYVNGNNTAPFGYAVPASSIFLNTTGSDHQVILDWNEFVPWQNFSYTIYKADEFGNYDSLTTTTDNFYIDPNVANGEEGCYYIESHGSYFINNLSDTLVNLSQESCAIAEDSIPPCVPELTVSNICDVGGISNNDQFENILHWNFLGDDCQQANDDYEVSIFFSSTQDLDNLELVGIFGPNEERYSDIREEAFGCYIIRTVDSTGNQSDFSPWYCVEVCPFYELPNVFTPNGDGFNDILIPRESRFIERIDMKIYNRWGNLVHETTNPLIEWDGSDLNGNPLPSGTYFYQAEIFIFAEIDSPERSSQINGYIEIIKE